jgi:phospholipase/lecithinase/hemolysin
MKHSWNLRALRQIAKCGAARSYVCGCLLLRQSKTKFVAIVLLIGAASLSFAQQSVAQPFNQVIVFGDSNVDSGFYKALSNPGGSATFNGYWASAVAHGAGAPTTNPDPVKSQILASYFGLTANPSNTAGGTNYATSGAKNVTINNSQTGGFTAAVPTVTQISNYLSANGGVANSQALYLIYSGDNDIKYALGASGTGPYPPDPNAYMTTAASDLATAIASLHSAGAKSIIVSGLAYSFPTGGGNAAERALKLLYTQALWNDLTNASVPFFKGDIDTVRVAINANPANYGFTSVTNTPGNVGCTLPSGVTTAWSLLCSSDPAAPSTWVSPTAPQTYLFADDQHLGTSGQTLMARYFRNLVVPWTVTHDFNGDGKSDILWRNTNSDLAIWLMNGTQISSGVDLGGVPNSWSVVGQRDFNADGKTDLLWRNTNGDLAIWLMNGTQVSSGVDLGLVPTSWSVVGTGDFNGDGKADLLWRNTNGDLAIWLMNGTQVSSGVDLGFVDTSWSVVGTGDFNGDGKIDILWRNTNGDLAIWLMNGTQVSSGVDLGFVDTSWTVAGTGDFNGDGKLDILWRNTNGDVAIWLMNGTQIASGADLGGVPTSWSIVGTGDFNGDGKSDIVWRNTNSDTAVWLMNGTAISSGVDLGLVPSSWSVQSANSD